MTSVILVGGAVALVFGVGGAAPASADPNAGSSDPSPFSTLRCACRETAAAGGEVRRDEIDRGIREGSRCLVARATRTGPARAIPAVTYARLEPRVVREGVEARHG